MASDSAAGLTPHHRLHAACWQVLLPAATGRWDEVRDRAAEAERIVDANLAAGTPCVLTVSILLNCAAASARAGDQEEARRLENKALEIGMKGNRWYQGWIRRCPALSASPARSLQEGTFINPFALRALGIARDDQALLKQALERFEVMGLT